jgi:hypothetical protein
VTTAVGLEKTNDDPTKYCRLWGFSCEFWTPGGISTERQWAPEPGQCSTAPSVGSFALGRLMFYSLQAADRRLLHELGWNTSLVCNHSRWNHSRWRPDVYRLEGVQGGQGGYLLATEDRSKNQ